MIPSIRFVLLLSLASVATADALIWLAVYLNR